MHICNMKIALVNTSDRIGGAAIACYRLFQALHSTNEVDVTFLVKEKVTDDDRIQKVNTDYISEKKGQLNFILEKLTFLPKESSSKIRFYFSNPNFGQDISQHPDIQAADIIHLHWINKGFLSFKSLEKLIALGKPIVWTMHDMWTFTGGCHYAGHCDHYLQTCGHCNYLKNPTANDLSNKIWSKKKALYQKGNFQFVTCSQWLGRVAKTSGLLNNQSVTNIPNPLNTSLFKPDGKGKKERPTILFQAMNINEERKGLKYLLESLQLLKERYPDFAATLRLVIFGKSKTDILDKIGIETEYLGLIAGDQAIIEAYNKADCFVIPSLEDNLPNTVMEALACGKPVVGFDTGGIPEMVNHKKNGYIAAQKDVKALAEGIYWVLNDTKRYQELSENARQKVITTYAFDKIAKRYTTLYQQVLKGQVADVLV